MIIKIVRYRKKTDTIDGQLYIEGMCICDCAENAKSAIKAGQYIISICKCKQHARKMPVVLLNGESSKGVTAAAKGNIPSPSPKCDCCKKLDFVSNNTTLPLYCPMIKPGNGVYHREDGSIIVGEYLAPGCLKHPKEAFDAIYDRIRKNVERQKQREQNRACSNSAESRNGVGDSQRSNDVTLIIEERYPQPKPKELSPFEMGTQILAQMGGRKLNL